MNPSVPQNKSTNVRTHLLRRAFAGASVVAAPLAAVMAEILFRTPRRFARPERERGVVEAGRRIALGVDGVDLAAWEWGTGPTVLLVHGWEGRGSQLGALVEPLVARGFRVVAFDAPAHGDSPGRLSSLAAFRDAVLAAGRRFGPLHAVVAHSMGGPATLLALTAGLRADAVALVAPPSSLARMVDGFAGQIALGERARRRMQASLEGLLGCTFEEVEASVVAPRMTAAALVVHDRDDREVPWESGRAVADAWPGATLLTTHGLGHRRILADTETIAAIVRFVADAAPATEPRRDLDRWLDWVGVDLVLPAA